MSETCSYRYKNFIDVLDTIILKNCDIAANKSFQDHGLVVAIKGAWGTGKSFFLAEYFEHLKSSDNIIYEKKFTFVKQAIKPYMKIEKNESNKIKVIPVKINIWEDDLFAPEEALFSSLTSFLMNEKGSSVIRAKDIIGKIRENVSFNMPGLNVALKNNDSKSLSFSKLLKDYKRYLNKVIENKDKDGEKYYLLFIIDELDRCIPSYSLRFLEVMKHFYNIERSIFLLAYDKDSILNSIRHIYGTNQPNKYLSRFIDFELGLPSYPKQKKNYIEEHLTSRGGASEGSDCFEELLLDCSHLFNISYREIAKIINYYSSLIDLTVYNRSDFWLLMIMKHVNEEAYNAITEDLYINFPSGEMDGCFFYIKEIFRYFNVELTEGQTDIKITDKNISDNTEAAISLLVYSVIFKKLQIEEERKARCLMDLEKLLCAYLYPKEQLKSLPTMFDNWIKLINCMHADFL